MKNYMVMIGVALLMTADICLAGPDIDSLALDNNKRSLLEKAAILLDEIPTPEDIQWLNEQLVPGNEPINILAAAILYRADTVSYQNVLFEYFTVHDYSERARGDQNVISQDDFIAAVAKIEKQVDKEFSDRYLNFLFGYWYYRDRDEWVTLMVDEPISVARFFRTAFLSAVLDLKQGQILTLANRLDRVAIGDAESSR